MRGSKGFEIRRRAALCVYVCATTAMLFVVCGCGEQLNRMEENQVKLQAMMEANAKELAALSSQVNAETAKLGEGIQNLDTQAQGITEGLQTVQGQQKQLHETVVAGNQGLDQRLDARTAALREGQQSLGAQVTQVHDVAQRTAADLTTLSQHQAGLRETVLANQQELNAHMGVVLSNQQGIQAGVARLYEADERLAQSIAAVAGRQDTLSATLRDNHTQMAERLATIAAAQTATQDSLAGNHQQVADRLAGLAESQQRLHAGVETLDGKMARMNEDMASAASALQTRLTGSHDAITTQVAGLAAGQQDLQTRIDALNAKADKAAADSEGAVSSLQETLRVNREVVTGQMAAGLQNQQAIQAAVQDLHGKADGLAGNLAAVSAEQTAAKDTSRVHHDEIITAMAGLSDGHQSLRSGIEQVSGKADQIGSGLASMASEQKALQETTQANHQAVLARFGEQSNSQAQLQNGLNTLNDKADAAASELSAAAQRQNALQQSVTAGNDALAAHAAVVAENHQNVKTAIADLGARTQQVSTDLAALASAQDTFRRQQSNHNETMTTRMTGLAEGQQALRDQVDLLTATTNQTALSMLTLNNSQATFQQTMQAGMNGLHERTEQTAANIKGMIELNAAMNQAIAAQAATMTENQRTMKADITRMAGVVDRAYADLTAVSLAQDTLQSTVTGRSDQISDRVARLDSNQKELAESLNILTATAGQTALDVMGLATGHAELNRTIQAGNDAVVARTATLANNQETLGSQLDVLTATASQTAADVIAVSDRQNTLAGAVQAYTDSANGHMTKLAENQQRMQSNLDVLTATTGQTAVDLIEAAERQAQFAKAAQSHNASTDARMTRLDENLQKMQGGLDTLAATTGQTAKDVVEAAERQAQFAKAVQSHNASTDARMTRLDENQQKMQSGLDTLSATAGQTAVNVIEAAERQAQFAKAVQSHNESADIRMTKLDENQQKMQGGLDTLAATTGQTAKGVIEAAAQQAQFAKAVQSHNASTDARMTRLDENQQKMQSGLDTLAAATGQTAKDLTAVTGRQDALAQAILTHEESVLGRIAKLDENQQKTQDGIGTVATTAGQAVRDIAALNEMQTRSEQTAQAGRVELAAKLAEIAQGQQGWIERFDAAQARVQTMADAIATLDQQLGKLQGVLQTGVQTTSAALDANGQQRQQFEARIAQDVQAMIEALSQLRQTQAQLQEQMTQVHKSTQSQADTLKTTIEQLKAAPAQQPPVEVKVSDSAKPAEPVIVQTGE